MTLLDELTTGPLSAEIAPHIASRNIDAILAAFYRKDIQVYSKIKVGVFADWLATTGLRSIVEDHSNNIASPLRNNALSILDLLRGSHEYLIDFGEPSKQALLSEWVTNGGITAQQQSEFLAKTRTLICRADQLDFSVTATTIREALSGGVSPWSTEIVNSLIENSGALLVTADFKFGTETHRRTVQVFNPTPATINAALRRERSLLEAAADTIVPVGALNIDI